MHGRTNGRPAKYAQPVRAVTGESRLLYRSMGATYAEVCWLSRPTERYAWTMPAMTDAPQMRFFLNVRTLDTLLVDDEGDDFPNLGEACKHAIQVASELAREYPRLPAHPLSIVPVALEVLDPSGALVFSTPIH